MAAGMGGGGSPMAIGGNPMGMGCNPMGMGGMMARASPYGLSSPQTTGPVSSDPEALQEVMNVIDEKARSLLQQLPEEKQVELASFLRAKIQTGTIMNPSGWMVKSCMAAGAASGGSPMAIGGNPMGMGGNPMGMGGNLMGNMGGGCPAQSVRSATATPTVPQMPQAVPLVMMILDNKAKSLFQQLPHEKQVDLASFLQQKMASGDIRNPSAWMAKSCLAAGASTGTEIHH